MKICFATNNQHKIAEFKKILPPYIELVGLKDIGCTEELEETRTTLEGNSLQKAEYVFANYKVPCFADDTGLEVFALDGAPGVYSARYAGEPSNSENNMTLLLSNLQGIDDRKAQFKTVITFINGQGSVKQFEGIAKGEIINERTGDAGFGYDPIFKPEGHDVTFAQMTTDEKNKISHRGIAVKKLVQYLTDRIN